MDNFIRKKIVLSLLDNDSKSANEIANEIGESLPTVEEQLTTLVSENICEKVNQDEVDHYVVKNDIKTFTQLVKEFLSDKEEHKEQIKQFITSDYYFNRINDELVDYVLKRFYLDSVYQSEEEKLVIKRILLVSPSALFFALYGDTTSFRVSWDHWNQLKPSDETRAWFTRIMRSAFGFPLSKHLFTDIKDVYFGSLFEKLGIRAVKMNIQVSLATFDEKYVEAIGGQTFSICKGAEDLTEELRPGQLVSFVNPMDLSDYGLANLNLGEFQLAQKNFNDALDAVTEPIEKAKVLNNKGLAFYMFRQYKKAVEYLEEGIALDVEDEISELRANKQLAEEYLAIATDADNLSEPTRIRFVLDQPVPFEETLFYEFKEIKGGNPANSITDIVDKYAVAFLNRLGGRIFWGIRDSDRITVGVSLDERQRDNVRCKVSEKLWGIRPSISDEDWDLEFHQVYELQGNTTVDLWVVELVISPQQKKEVFYTNSGELFVKTPGGKQKLLGPQVTEFIRDRLQDDTETT